MGEWIRSPQECEESNGGIEPGEMLCNLGTPWFEVLGEEEKEST